MIHLLKAKVSYFLYPELEKEKYIEDWAAASFLISETMLYVLVMHYYDEFHLI